MTNAAAIGYMILAAKAAGMPEEDIRELEDSMNIYMDLSTEEQAEQAYREF